MSKAFVSEYRKFILSLSQELSTENLHSLKYLLRDLLTMREIESAVSAIDFFVFLEQRNELGSENCHLLQDLLTQIRREDLVGKLKEFEMKQLAEKAEQDSVANYQTRNGFRAVNMADMQDCVTDSQRVSTVAENNNEYVVPRGHQIMLRDVRADVCERLGFLLNPASHKNWIYLAGKLGYTYEHVLNFKLRPMQSMDWAMRADATVLKLYQALEEIGRADAARELEPILANPM